MYPSTVMRYLLIWRISFGLTIDGITEIIPEITTLFFETSAQYDTIHTSAMINTNQDTCSYCVPLSLSISLGDERTVLETSSTSMRSM